MRSYESISSNSTDSTRTANEAGNALGGGGINGGNEHLYDSVATDNGDAGEYVYVKAGSSSTGIRGGGYSSSRDNLSTNSGNVSGGGVAGDADSNSGVSNYVNIDYFIQ